MNLYALQLVTAPAERPVDISQAKQWLKIADDQTADDDLIEGVIDAVTERMQAEYGFAFVTQTWKMFMDSFPCGYEDGYETFGVITLPKTPLQSVTHVKYYDTNDAQQTLVVNTDYIVDAVSRPARIAPAYGKYWPSTRYKPNAVEIQFVCGFGAAVTVPPELKRELQVRLTHAYENRGFDEPAAGFPGGRWPERRINV
jgi:uncharacterized phiE125 gp8 family phage protein